MRELIDRHARLDTRARHPRPRDHAAGAPAIAARASAARVRKFPWPEEDARYRRCVAAARATASVVAGGDETLTALHTPGHSPDHLAFWHEPSAHGLHRRPRRAGQQRHDSLRAAAATSAQYLASLERLLRARAAAPASRRTARRSTIRARAARSTSRTGACASGRCSTRCARAARRCRRSPNPSMMVSHPALMPAARENVRAHLEKLKTRRDARSTTTWRSWSAAQE